MGLARGIVRSRESLGRVIVGLASRARLGDREGSRVALGWVVARTRESRSVAV